MLHLLLNNFMLDLVLVIESLISEIYKQLAQYCGAGQNLKQHHYLIYYLHSLLEWAQYLIDFLHKSDLQLAKWLYLEIIFRIRHFILF